MVDKGRFAHVIGVFRTGAVSSIVAMPVIVRSPLEGEGGSAQPQAMMGEGCSYLSPIAAVRRTFFIVQSNKRAARERSEKARFGKEEL